MGCHLYCLGILPISFIPIYALCTFSWAYGLTHWPFCVYIYICVKVNLCLMESNHSAISTKWPNFLSKNESSGYNIAELGSWEGPKPTHCHISIPTGHSPDPCKIVNIVKWFCEILFFIVIPSMHISCTTSLLSVLTVRGWCYFYTKCCYFHIIWYGNNK